MCWDLIVIFALITVLLVLTYLLVLGISLIRHESLNSSVFCSGLALALVGALAVMAVQAKVNA